MAHKVTVAINSCNGLEYLKQVIPAWINQDFDDFELILIDDGSNDGTYEYAQTFGNKIRYHKISDTPRTGYGYSKNSCVENADGEYVLLIDNDILPPDNKFLDEMYTYYKESYNNDILGIGLYDKESSRTKYYGIFFSLTGINVRKKAVDIDSLMKYKCPIPVGSYHGGAVFFRKKLWSQISGYDTIQPFMLDDTDFSARAYNLGYKVFLYNRRLLAHIGISNHTDKKYFAWKFKYYFSGIATTMLKNFYARNLYRLIIFTVVCPVIYLGVALTKRNLRIIVSYFISWYIFLANMPKILKSRRDIQKSRIIDTDLILSIKEPF